MASVSPAVTPAVAASSSVRPVAFTRTTPVTGSTPAVSSSVIVLSVGSALQAPLLYTVSGLLVSVIAPPPMTPAPSSTSAQASRSTANATRVATPAVAPATSAPVASAAPAATGTSTDVITPLAVTTLVDPAARALADFSANPVYGGMAAALYVNAANYRSQHPSVDQTAAIDLPGPVAAIRAVTGAIAEGKPQSPEHRRRGAQERGVMKQHEAVRGTLESDFTSQLFRNRETQMA